MPETPHRVSITWSSPFCVGADEADEAPPAKTKTLVAAKR